MPNRDEPPFPDDDEEPARRPYPESLCWRCAHHRAIKTARYSFVMCNALPVKYPRQPVSSCPAFTRAPS
jgi:hypothetical protein